MNTSAPAVTPQEDTKPTDPRREVIINLAVNVAAPLAVFYGLRAAGVGQWLALTLGVVPPAIRAVHTVATRRRVDVLALFALSVILLSVTVSFLTGSPRFLLAKDGWLTALGGLWLLATLPRTPFYFQAIRSVTAGATRERVETAWRESPAFQHIMRVATAIWGVGLVLDAGVRLVLAYTLPIDQVPLVSGLQYVAVFLALRWAARSTCVVRAHESTPKPDRHGKTPHDRGWSAVPDLYLVLPGDLAFGQAGRAHALHPGAVRRADQRRDPPAHQVRRVTRPEEPLGALEQVGVVLVPAEPRAVR